MQVTLGKALLTSHQLKSHRVWEWLGYAYVCPAVAALLVCRQCTGSTQSLAAQCHCLRLSCACMKLILEVMLSSTFILRIPRVPPSTLLLHTDLLASCSFSPALQLFADTQACAWACECQHAHVRVAADTCSRVQVICWILGFHAIIIAALQILGPLGGANAVVEEDQLAEREQHIMGTEAAADGEYRIDMHGGQVCVPAAALVQVTAAQSPAGSA